MVNVVCFRHVKTMNLNYDAEFAAAGAFLKGLKEENYV